MSILRNRRGFIVVTSVLVIIGILLSWLIRPQADVRFVGEWSIDSDPGTIRFDDRGGGAFSEGDRFRWWVADNKLYVQEEPAGLQAQLNGMLNRLRGTAPKGSTMEIVDTDRDRIRGKNAAGQIVTMTRLD